MDPDSDPDPAIFIIDLQDANKTLFFEMVFLHITVLYEGTWVHIHHFSKIKSKKEVTKQ
jgi:hypothetical protein